jgi:hypothetical protein
VDRGSSSARPPHNCCCTYPSDQCTTTTAAVPAKLGKISSAMRNYSEQNAARPFTTGMRILCMVVKQEFFFSASQTGDKMCPIDLGAAW